MCGWAFPEVAWKASFPIRACRSGILFFSRIIRTSCMEASGDMMEHNTYGLTNELRRNGQLQIFLSLIAESAGTQARPEEDRANQYVKRAVEFIQRNYCNPVKVTDVADYVCINRSYLYTLFENSMGMSPQQFLTAFRLTRAAELLAVTQLPVESIALSCGYNDPLVFTKAFKQMKGMSPSLPEGASERGRPAGTGNIFGRWRILSAR